MKTRILMVEYWDCGIEKHRHRKKKTAIKCVQKQTKKQIEPPSISKYKTILRNTDIFERLIINEEKRKDLAKEYNLSPSSISMETLNLGFSQLYRRGFITKDEYLCRKMSAWRKNKAQFKELLYKAREYANFELKKGDK